MRSRRSRAVALVLTISSLLGTSSIVGAQSPSPAALASESPAASPAASPASEEPTAEAGLLPGVSLVTEEIEPRVLKVVSDGIRDLSRPIRWDPRENSIVAGLDGSVWLFWPRRFFRLGARTNEYPRKLRPKPGQSVGDVAVGPDGTVWRAFGDLSSFDGETWKVRRSAPQKGEVHQVEIQRDGTAWGAWRDRKNRLTVARRADRGWEPLPGKPKGWLPVLAVSDHDDVLMSSILPHALRRHDGSGWVPLEAPEGEPKNLGMAPNGTAWVHLDRDDGGESTVVLRRWDGQAWSEFGPADGLPSEYGDPFRGALQAVAPDGSVWFHPNAQRASLLDWCDGVANWNGETLTYFLRDLCIYDIAVAPDGTVWLQAGRPGTEQFGEILDEGPIETYAIIPAPDASTEPAETDAATSDEAPVDDQAA